MYWFRFTKDGKDAWVNLERAITIDSLMVGGVEHARIFAIGSGALLLTLEDTARLRECLKEELPGCYA